MRINRGNICQRAWHVEALNDIQALFIMNSGILISDFPKVEISVFPILDSEELRQVPWVRFSHQG